MQYQQVQGGHYGSPAMMVQQPASSHPQSAGMYPPASPYGAGSTTPPLPYGASHSQGSLPRYGSQTSGLSSPLNPAAANNNNNSGSFGPSGRSSNTSGNANGGYASPQGQAGNAGNAGNNGVYSSSNSMASGLNSRYSTYGYANGGPGATGGAHPLSHALYADSPSSPTLAGDDDSHLDEKKGLASFPPSTSSSSGSGERNKAAMPGKSDAAYRRWSGAFIADSGRDPRHTKTERIGWIDGLRFLAAWIVLNGTFFDAVIPDTSMYTPIHRNSPLYIFRSFGLGLSFFLIILGRAITAPLWDLSFNSSQPGKSSAAAPTGPIISFPRLTRAMLTRTARFVLPVLVVGALIWALGATNATKDCNSAGMQQPYWNLIQSFAGYMTIVFNSFSAFSFQTSAAQFFAGNLWTNAWFYQASYCVYICHMMLGNLSSSRFWVYGILICFMWFSYQYFALAMIGAMFSDLAAHGVFARIKKWPLIRVIAIQIILIAIAVVIQFVNVVRDNLNSAFATINVNGNTELQIADLIFAACFFLVFETSHILQIVLGNIVMRMLGKLAPGMYLLAPAIVFTIVPSLAVSLSKNGTSGSGVLGVTWIVTFAICTVAAIPFHFLVELPSKLAGEFVGDFLEGWGATPHDFKVHVKGPQTSAPKKISGPGAK